MIPHRAIFSESLGLQVSESPSLRPPLRGLRWTPGGLRRAPEGLRCAPEGLRWAPGGLRWARGV